MRVSESTPKERELMQAIAQAMCNKFHADYPEGTQPGDATRLAMGYLNLLHDFNEQADELASHDSGLVDY